MPTNPLTLLLWLVLAGLALAAYTDRAVVRVDYAAEYNLGLIWAQRTDATLRQEGLARLATACRIDEQYQLGSGVACSAPHTLAGPRTRWPAPLVDPLSHMPGSGR